MPRKLYDGIEEKIQTFKFRENASLKIPKAIRERAFTLQVDVKIKAFSKLNYLNFKSNPANGFYGYVTLVQRDYADIVIPIQQPLQRIYYHINEMAHNSWYQLYIFLLELEDKKYLYDNRLNKIDIAVGVSSGNVNIECPVKPIWQETTLREIYIECDKGTEFDVEISYWQAKPMEIADCAYDGKSGIIDGDKDKGLPANGAQPVAKSPSSNPFANSPPASTLAQLGDFANNKGSLLDNANPDNGIGNTGLRYSVVAYQVTFLTTCEDGEWELNLPLQSNLLEPPNYSYVQSSTFQSCGQQISVGNIFINGVSTTPTSGVAGRLRLFTLVYEVGQEPTGLYFTFRRRNLQ